MQVTPLSAFRYGVPRTRRGFCLWLFSLAFMALGGFNYLSSDGLPESTRDTLTFPLLLTGGHVWPYGVLMIGLGVFGWVSSFCHYGRDRFGYIALAVFCAGWSLFAFFGFLAYDAPTRALGQAAIWALLAAILIVVSGFPYVRPPDMRDEPGPKVR